jgi:hypothetical protein
LPKQKFDNNDEADGVVDHDRRRALVSMGRFAAYVTPAMTVLIPGDETKAHHQAGHTSNCRNFPNSPFCASFF